MKRRNFLAKTALGATALTLNACHRPEEKMEDGSIKISKEKK